MSFTIPPKSRPEWRNIVQGRTDQQFKNYVLQMRVNQAINDIENGDISVSQAVDAIYELCSKYALAVQVDLKKIFKTW